LAKILGPIAIRYRDASRQRTWSADSGPCDRVRVDSSLRRREDGLPGRGDFWRLANEYVVAQLAVREQAFVAPLACVST